METAIEFCKGSTLKVFSHDEPILQEGSVGQFLYVLLDGKINVSKNDLFVTDLSNRGAILGEMALLLGLPYSATCKSVGTSKLYEVQINSAFIDKNPQFLFFIARDLASKLNKATICLTASLERKTAYDPIEFRRQTEHFNSILAEIY